MKAEVVVGHTVSGVIAQIDAAIESGFAPTVAIAFCSVTLNHYDLSRDLAARDLAVLGATSAGEIAGESAFNETAVVMLLELDMSAAQVAFEDGEVVGGLDAAARRIGIRAKETFDNPIIILLGSGVQANGENIVWGIRDIVGDHVPLFGGMAGDDLKMAHTWVFSGEKSSREGVLALILDDSRYEVLGTATNGWQPVGIEKRITRSEGHLVYEIGGRPAIEVYSDYLDTIEVRMDGPPVTAAVGVHYPLAIRRENGTVVLRPPTFYDPERGAVVFAGSVPEGSFARFCIPPDVDTVERLLDELAVVKHSMPAADFVLHISCVARRMALDVLADDESRAIDEVWKAPLIGFYSYGEIGGPTPEECDFHTESCTIVAVRDRLARR
jgi:hypothetical protein